MTEHNPTKTEIERLLDSSVALFLQVETHRNDCFVCRQALHEVDQILNYGKRESVVTDAMKARIKELDGDMCVEGQALMKRMGEVTMAYADAKGNRE